jgi:hypothetical protein
MVHWDDERVAKWGRRIHWTAVHTEAELNINVEKNLLEHRRDRYPALLFRMQKSPLVGVIMGSSNDLPTMHTAVGRYIATLLHTKRGRRHCCGTQPHNGEMNVAGASGVTQSDSNEYRSITTNVRLSP